MLGRQKLDELSVTELEKMVLLKKRQSRLERFRRLSGEGRPPAEALLGPERVLPPASPPGPSFRATTVKPLATFFPANKKVMDKLLLGIEIMALAGLVILLATSYFSLQEFNSELSAAHKSAVAPLPPPATIAPPIALARLPGGHTSPTAPGGAMPDVPLHLQQWVQPALTLSATTLAVDPQSRPPTRIQIPKLKVDAPIVAGVGWEDLKKGVGHLPGSANPGERGNLYLAAHNDIYGEIFRHLERLAPGDEYFIYAGEQKFRYVVTEKRIIEPTAVEVMLPTTEPVATLQTCHPYLVNTHRLVVIGELAD
jgi:sortase A